MNDRNKRQRTDLEEVQWMPPPPPRRPPFQEQRRGYMEQKMMPPSPYLNRMSEPSPVKQNSSNSILNSNSMATSAISIHDTNHGLQRRMDRAIPQRHIQAAIKHGKSYPHHRDPNLVVYEYEGQKHVVTKDTRALVTAMITHHAVSLERKFISHEDRVHSDDIANRIRQDPQIWKSHTVLVVDKSGSMRNSDVNGARTRLGAVFQSIAQDFVDKRIQSGLATDQDVVTIILMGDNARVLIDRRPTDYLLFNDIVGFFEDSENSDREYCRNRQHGRRRQGQRRLFKVSAGGHGNYGPSLKLAENTLEKYDNASSALSLIVLSDGRPSDHARLKNRISPESAQALLVESVGKMASKFGRRFNFSTIGMGNMKNFDTLKEMVKSANSYGSLGEFQVPSMSCAAIGAAISSVATSLTACQTELVSMRGKNRKARRVREVLREQQKFIPMLTEVVDSEEFDIFMNENVSHMEYVTKDGEQKFHDAPFRHPEARGVAMKRVAFGEGSERLAHQFFEVAADGITVVGEPLVAKENRFIEDEEAQDDEHIKEEEKEGMEENKENEISKNDDTKERKWKARDKFANRFCKIQHKARSVADRFNSKLDEIKSLDPDTARISFLDCSIYYLNSETRGEYAVIVERKLDGKFQKWNNNNGWKKKRQSDLFLIKEEPDEENKNDTNEEATGEGTIDVPFDLTEDNNENCIFVNRDEVAQAFSHFSYVHSGRKMLICDLQGVYERHNNLFSFTDPVVHYHDVRQNRKRGIYGRTDMGQRGIDDFFKSHVCNGLCRLITKGFVTPSKSKKSKS